MDESMMQCQPIITLLTDFGLCDGFAGVMKGVMLQIAPGARLIDVSHDLPPHSISAASFLNEWSFGYFPVGTVHLCVTDPGVGTARRVLVVENSGHLFVAPDNGLLTPIFDDEGKTTIIHASNRRYWLDKVSHTFHGRDIYAPISAYLAIGVPASEMGGEITDPVRLTAPPLDVSPESILCRILYIDRFGNLVTNLDTKTFGAWIASKPCNDRQIIISWPGGRIQGVSKSYREKEPGEVLAVFDGYDRLEIAVREGNAAQITRLGIGSQIGIVTT